MSKALQLCMTECLSVEDIKTIIAKDKINYPITNDESNVMAYYSCCNTWCLMLRDMTKSNELGQILKRHIQYFGLIATIDECDEYADVLIQQLSHIDHIDHVLDIERLRDSTAYRWLFDCITSIMENYGLREVLQFLRFPKRLTLTLAEDAGEIKALLDVNNQVKMRDRKGYNSYFIPIMREAVRAYCTPWRPDAFPKTFSNGAAADSSSVKVCKLRAYNSSLITQEEWDGTRHILGFPSVEQDPDQWTVQPITVPKNAKRRRVIAPEHVWRQVEMSPLAQMFDHNMAISSVRDSKYPVILLHNQSVSRTAAKLSADPSSYRRYATIDLSHASDSVSEALVRTIFCEHAGDVCKYVARYLRVGKKRVVKYLYSTAGSKLTFPVESIVFASIAYTATELHSVFSNGLTMLRPIVYGDDIMVDERCAELCIEILEHFGFKVNISKSFSAGNFKESCGVESWMGVDVSSSFFPRHQFSNRKNGKVCADDVASLCELQHRVFEFKTASSFLIDYVRSLMPKMTSHYPQTDCSDLWELDPKPVVRSRGGRDYVPTSRIEQADWYYAISAKSVKDNDQELDRIFEYFIYMEYLERGPLFLDDIDRALGVSTSRLRRSDRYPQTSFYKLVQGD